VYIALLKNSIIVGSFFDEQSATKWSRGLQLIIFCRFSPEVSVVQRQIMQLYKVGLLSWVLIYKFKATTLKDNNDDPFFFTETVLLVFG